jgi:hypothetical protein
MLFERLADENHIPVIVLNKQNPKKLFHDGPAGSEKWNVEPTPGPLSAQILPP